MNQATRDPLLGQLIGGRYLIEEKIGQGGFGAVYRAHHSELQRDVALKFVSDDAPPSVLARFRREARTVASLRHPTIVTIHDFGVTEGRRWLAQEYVPGRSLEAILRERQCITVPCAVDITLAILSGLSVAHEAGIIHRDIKPGNVMLASGLLGSGVRILDFGIARTEIDPDETRLTRTGLIIGTPLYMSPEQARNTGVDATTDLYALGAVLYHMLAGRPPFVAADALSTVISHIQSPVPPLPDGVPAAVQDVVFRALAKHPADRFPDASHMASALRSALATPPEVAKPTRDGFGFAVAAAAAVGLASLALFAVLDRAPWQADPWQAEEKTAGLAALATDAMHLADSSVDATPPEDSSPSDGTSDGRPDVHDTDPAIPADLDSGTEPSTAPEASGGPRHDARIATQPYRRRATPAHRKRRPPPAEPTTLRIERALRLCRCDRARRDLDSVKEIPTAGGRAERVLTWPLLTTRDRERLDEQHRVRCRLLSSPCFSDGG